MAVKDRPLPQRKRDRRLLVRGGHTDTRTPYQQSPVVPVPHHITLNLRRRFINKLLCGSGGILLAELAESTLLTLALESTRALQVRDYNPESAVRVMLVHPGWRAEGLALECRRAQWVPHPRLASYVAPPYPLTLHAQIEDEYSSSSCGSSPEHGGGAGGEEWGEAAAGAGAEHECTCEWLGCGVRARGVSTLSAHVATRHAHPHADGLFYCGWRSCTRPHRGFNARYKMLVHVRTHTNEKPHECLQCHKCFSRAENLKIHMRSHSGEKPYVCPFEGCNKAYSNSSDRFKHTRTHAVDKPYCCKVAGCDKRYTDPSSLRKHVKTYRHFTGSPQHVAPAPLSPAAAEEPVRVPAYEMSYVEYCRVYGYPSSPGESLRCRNYNVILHNKDYMYEVAPYSDVAMREVTPPRQCEPLHLIEEPEEPLDLKCRRSDYLDTEELQMESAQDSMQFHVLRAMEMPLDLSNKT